MVWSVLMCCVARYAVCWLRTQDDLPAFVNSVTQDEIMRMQRELEVGLGGRLSMVLLHERYRTATLRHPLLTHMHSNWWELCDAQAWNVQWWNNEV